MRIEPSPKSLRSFESSADKSKIPLQQRVDRITRIVAIVVAFLSTFIFFFKILFF